MQKSKFTIIIKSLAFLLLFTLSQSCKKSSDNTTSNTTGFSDSINKIVTPAILDSLKSYGLVVNPGKQPPIINGIYLISPTYCIFDNSIGHDAGYTFSDYKFQFYGQDNTNLTIGLNYKNMTGTDNASGVGAFVAGNGNFFTAFIDSKGIANGINYEDIMIISGEVTTSGISHWQNALYRKSKGYDPNNTLINVGDCRIFTIGSGEGTATKTSTYRVANHSKFEDIGQGFGSMLTRRL